MKPGKYWSTMSLMARGMSGRHARKGRTRKESRGKKTDKPASSPVWADFQAGLAPETTGPQPGLGWQKGRLWARDERPPGRSRPIPRPVLLYGDGNFGDGGYGEKQGVMIPSARRRGEGCYGSESSPSRRRSDVEAGGGPQRRREARRCSDGRGEDGDGGVDSRRPGSIPLARRGRTSRRSCWWSSICSEKLQSTATGGGHGG